LVVVRLPFCDEPRGGLAALGHDVELEGRLAVPVDAEPPERALDLLDGLRDLAARVGVLDPEQARAAVLLREEPVEEERADAADVQETGRRRRHPYAHRANHVPP